MLATFGQRGRDRGPGCRLIDRLNSVWMERLDLTILELYISPFFLSFLGEISCRKDAVIMLYYMSSYCATNPTTCPPFLSSPRSFLV